MGSGKKMVFGDKSAIRDLLLEQVQKLWAEYVSRSPPVNSIELWDEHVKLREILDLIADLHKQLSDIDSAVLNGEQLRSKASMDKFSTWCQERGIISNGVRVVKCESMGFGLISNKNIQRGELIVEVPRKAMLSLDQAKKSPFLKKAFEHDVILQGMDNVGLALSVCCQRLSKDSMWIPYLNMLPSSFTTPLYNSINQMKALRPSPLYEEALLLYRNVVRQFAYFLLLLSRNNEFDKDKKNGTGAPLLYNTPISIDNFTFSLYRWAVCCVATRVNMIPSEILKLPNGEPKMIPALIPLLDMANHDVNADSDVQAVTFCTESDCAQIISSATLTPALPVVIFYGKRSNADFLLHNGFVPDGENGRFDSYRLKLGLNKSEKYFSSRIDKIVTLGFGGTAHSNIFVFELRNDTEPYSHKLLEFVRILVSDEPTDENINSDAIGKKASSWLQARLSLLIASYQKSPVIDDDIALMSSRLHLAEKRILEWALTYTKENSN